MIVTPPTTPHDLRDATWADLAPLYRDLLDAPMEDLERWLSQWSALEELVEEAATEAMIAYTCDTADEAREAANHRWSVEILPNVAEQQVALARRLVSDGRVPEGLEETIREFRTDIEIFREANVPLLAQIEELVATYQKITGNLSVAWDGASLTIPQVNAFLVERDRGTRERAFRAIADAYLAERNTLADLFDRMHALRDEIARNAGFPDYMRYAFAAKHRFHYSPDDCARFHDAVEATVAPAVERLMRERARVMQLEAVRPWDVRVPIDVSETIRPFTDESGLIQPALRIFDALDAELGLQFRRMESERLLDLASRPGKAPGGYCTNLHWRKLPFIFMNAVGLPDDVNTLVHEAGHCFHDFAANRQRYIWQRSMGHEAAELASMSMELLVTPHLQRPTGYYTAAEARAVEIELLEDLLQSLTHIASVDAFQRWIYTNPEGRDAAARDREWLDLRRRFERGVDWTGLDEARVSRWYRQLHIFELPFYYIEYGIAQLGALQLWRDARRDPAGTMARYKAFLALGGMRSLPELYRAAGVRLVFDRDGMLELVTLVEERVAELRSERLR